MANVIEGKNNFRPYQILLNDINSENIAKFKLAHVRGFFVFFLMTPNNIALV